MNNGDFPGCMKPIIPAWYPGERCEEGLRIGQELIIENWQERYSLKTVIFESWRKEGFQFFISENGSKMAIMGVLYLEENEIFLEVADEVEKYCNRNLWQDVPCFGGIWAKTVILEKDRSMAFLSVISKRMRLRRENKEKEEKLLEAVREFEKKKEIMCPKTINGFRAFFIKDIDFIFKYIKILIVYSSPCSSTGRAIPF